MTKEEAKKNLRPGRPFTSETARIAGAKGNAVMAQRKSFKESLKLLLDKSIKKGIPAIEADILELAENNGVPLTARDAMNIAMIQRAVLGDVSAFTAIRDTVGEKPSDKVEVDQSITIEEWAKNHKVKL